MTTWIKVWDWETWGLYLDSWTYLDLAPNLNDTYPLISHLIEYLGHPKSLSPPNDDDCYQQQKTRKSKVSVPVLLTWVNFIIGGALFNAIRSAVAVHLERKNIFEFSFWFSFAYLLTYVLPYNFNVCNTLQNYYKGQFHTSFSKITSTKPKKNLMQ